MKRSRLKPISDKRRTQIKEYGRLRRDFLDKNPICQVCGKKRSAQVHHKAGRFNQRLLDTENWMALCWPCHDQIHAAAARARAKGYLK